MPHYAITDGLVGLAALFSTAFLWRGLRADTPRLFIAAGYCTIFLAALIGTIRFSFGYVDALAQLHSFLSGLSGSIGMAWLIFAVASIGLKGARSSVALAAVWAVPAMLFVLSVKTNMIALQAVITGVVLLVTLFGVGAVLWRRSHKGLALHLFGAGLLLGALAAVRDTSFYGPDVGWHIYHSVLALWLLMLSRAFLKSDWRSTD